MQTRRNSSSYFLPESLAPPLCSASNHRLGFLLPFCCRSGPSRVLGAVHREDSASHWLLGDANPASGCQKPREGRKTERLDEWSRVGASAAPARATVANVCLWQTSGGGGVGGLWPSERLADPQASSTGSGSLGQRAGPTQTRPISSSGIVQSHLSPGLEGHHEDWDRLRNDPSVVGHGNSPATPNHQSPEADLDLLPFAAPYWLNNNQPHYFFNLAFLWDERGLRKHLAAMLTDANRMLQHHR